MTATDVSKHYGGVVALDDVTLRIYPGEVVALVGDNGAGKSTLVNVLTGAIAPDTGTLAIDGQVVTLGSPQNARDLGIDAVYQDLALAGDLSAAANVFLGRELRRPGILGKLRVLDQARMATRSEEVLSRLSIALPRRNLPVAALSGGQRQCIAVARAVAWASRLLIMDEPTAALGVAQTRLVLESIKRVRAEGTPVLVVSHNMHDVFEVADRIAVLRLGRLTAEFTVGECTAEDVIGAITGASTLPTATRR